MWQFKVWTVGIEGQGLEVRGEDYVAKIWLQVRVLGVLGATRVRFVLLSGRRIFY